MAVLSIPTETTISNYDFFITLDGVEFSLTFIFNERDESWIMNISDANENPLRSGLKVVNEFPLLRLWQEQASPGGDMIAVNEGDSVQPPTLNQLGSDVILTYLDASELEAVGL